MTHAEWAAKHIALFGLQGEDAADSAAEWARFFSRLGFPPDELMRASYWLAENRAGQLGWLREHKDAILECVQRRRQEDLAGTARDDPGVCARCLGSGWVVRPRQPDMVPEGVEDVAAFLRLYPEVVVTCNCRKGRNVHETLSTRRSRAQTRAPLSLEEYTARHGMPARTATPPKG